MGRAACPVPRASVPWCTGRTGDHPLQRPSLRTAIRSARGRRRQAGVNHVAARRTSSGAAQRHPENSVTKQRRRPEASTTGEQHHRGTAPSGMSERKGAAVRRTAGPALPTVHADHRRPLRRNGTLQPGQSGGECPSRPWPPGWRRRAEPAAAARGSRRVSGAPTARRRRAAGPIAAVIRRIWSSARARAAWSSSGERRTRTSGWPAPAAADPAGRAGRATAAWPASLIGAATGSPVAAPLGGSASSASTSARRATPRGGESGGSRPPGASCRRQRDRRSAA